MNIPFVTKTNILYILRAICRYYIAYNMFSYAFGKILKSQFDLGLTYATDIGLDNFNGFMLTWYYYGYSRSYGLVIASTQIVAGLLLLFRKTERLGVVLFLSFMVNILFVDIFYEIDGALWQAAKLTALGIFLLLSDWKGFKTYFLKVFEQVHAIPQIIPEKFRNVYWLKFLMIPLIVLYAYADISNLKEQFHLKNELFGIWRNVSGYDDTSHRLYKVTFDYDNGLRIKDFSKNIYYGDITLDSDTKLIELSATHYSEEAHYFVKDSLEQLPDDQKEDKNIKDQIKAYYHAMNQSLPFDKETYFYEIKEDTLMLHQQNQKDIKFINVTKGDSD